MEAMSEKMQEVMDMLQKMSPEELEAQMKEAVEMLTQGDMIDTMLQHTDDILKQLEETQAVPPEELAKFRADPDYFKEKMKESMNQMKTLFQDPDMMKQATKAMTAMMKLFSNPDQLEDLFKQLQADFSSDESIEEVRQQLLQNPELGHPALKNLFESEEMQDMIKDPVKWRESVKQGQKLLLDGGLPKDGAAGMGEL